MKLLNVAMKYLKNIIITHYDDDHIGSLHDFKEKYPWIKYFDEYYFAINTR